MITAIENLSSDPVEYPITLSDAKRHLRVTHNFEDEKIERLIASATAWAQTETRRFFMSFPGRMRIDRFPFDRESVRWQGIEFRYMSPYFTRLPTREIAARRRAIFLPGGKVQSVQQIDYVDTEGATQTLTGPTSTPAGTDYQEDLTDEEEAHVMPPREGSWPGVQSGLVNAVTIDFTPGFGASREDIPEDIRHAIRLKVSDLFIDGDDKIETAAKNMLSPHVIRVY